jgi:hypothetical protein
MGISIRRMERGDLACVLDWAAAEGWNPGLYDAEPFYAADPDGFFLALLDGEPIGSLSAVAYDDRFGFMGLFIVRRQFRGGRVGVELARTGCDYLGSRTVGLDGVTAKQSNYAKHGFRFVNQTIRYEGVGSGARSPIKDSPMRFVELTALSPSEFATYDAEMFPARRPEFLHAWIRQPGTKSLGLMRNDRLAAYGVLRPCRTGHKIGPLVADDPYLAEVLFQELAAIRKGELIYLDVPEPNGAGIALALKHGMRPVFETSRMYAGPLPATDLSRLFGVTSMELG